MDILYENGVHSGVFQRFTQTTARPSTYIPVECKNYTRGIGNSEVDQLIARFSNQRGWLGLLICRANEDPAGLIARCRDAYQAGHTWENHLPAPCRDHGVFDRRKNLARGWRRSMPELLVYFCEFTRKTLVFHRLHTPRRLIRRCVSVG